MQSEQEFLAHFTDFANSLCEQWGLPMVDVGEEAQPSKFLRTYRMRTDIDDVPILLPHPRECQWQSATGRIWIQTDNQQVARIFSGRSTLEAEHYRPLCVRIARILYSIINSGMRGMTDISDLILWDGREYNTVADHAANMALDTQTSWERLDVEFLKVALEEAANLRLCIDGACRAQKDGAVGMALFAYSRNGGCRLVYRAGKPLGDTRSAFLAELLALEFGLQTFVSLCMEKVHGQFTC